MEASTKLIDFLKKWEVFSATAYKPTPKDRWTVGYGSTFYADNRPVKESDVVTEEEATDLLKLQVKRVSLAVTTFMPHTCTQQQFDAVVSLAYNAGIHAIENSDTGILFQSGCNIANRFQLWNKQKDKELKGLTIRRLAERKIYEEGAYV